jgi:hypothetical protein
MASEAKHAAGGRRLKSLLACVQLAGSYTWIGTGTANEALDALVRRFDPADIGFHLVEGFTRGHLPRRSHSPVGPYPTRSAASSTISTSSPPVASAPTLHTHFWDARAVFAGDGDAEEFYDKALAPTRTRQMAAPPRPGHPSLAPRCPAPRSRSS